jgi:hypothetical protein
VNILNIQYSKFGKNAYGNGAFWNGLYLSSFVATYILHITVFDTIVAFVIHLVALLTSTFVL